MLANVDTWTVVFKGTGGHGAVPHRATDPSVPLPVGHFLTGMQSIIGRSVPARETAVISAGYIAGGHPDSGNVIPSEITVHGTARSYDPAVRDILENRLSELAKNLAAAYGCSASVLYERGYPALVNCVDQTAIAAKAADSVTGEANVNTDFPPITAGEDFAYMLQHKPGAFMLMGNGVDAGNRFHHVHTPHYDFNDDAIPFGITYWVSLVSIELG